MSMPWKSDSDKIGQCRTRIPWKRITRSPCLDLFRGLTLVASHDTILFWNLRHHPDYLKSVMQHEQALNGRGQQFYP